MMAAPPRHDGLFARARYTPMRDVIRLRLTGRLNIRRLIADAQLPQPLAETVLQVVRRTRLSRLEKVDVAEELTSHFADGLAAGRTAEQLQREFGDCTRAARLIRRAKRRNHSAIRKLPRYCAYGLGVLAVFYLAIAIRFFAGSPSITHDYLADLNSAAAAAAPEQRGWPLYRQGLLQLGEQPEWEGETPPTRPGDPGWDRMEAYLTQNADALAIVRQAASKPHLGYIAGFGIDEADSRLWPEIATEDELDENADTSLIGVLLPHLASLRNVSRVLDSDVHRAAAAGDAETVLGNVAALLGISEHTRETPTLISELVSFAVFALALEAAGDVLAEYPDLFTDDELTQLAHSVAAAHGGGALHVDIASERLWFGDVMQRVYTDDGNGNGRVTAEGVQWLMNATSIHNSSLMNASNELAWYSKALLPGATLLLANRRDMVAKYNELMTRAEVEGRMPLWNRRDTVEPDVELMASDPVQSIRYAPITLLMPAMTKATSQGEKATMRRDAVLVAIALELHRRRTGQWPATLEELVPHLLPDVPRDRFDGQPLRYTIAAGRPVLYSVGTDLEDDGGRAPSLPSRRVHSGHPSRWIHPDRVAQLKASHRASAELPEGDWVLWPPMRQ